MICPSCQEEISPPKIHKVAFTSSHYCKMCKEEHIVWESVKPGHYAAQWGKYRLYCEPDNNRCLLQQIYFDIESDTSIMYRWHTILELSAIPQNLSEETVEDKIKTILLFS